MMKMRGNEDCRIESVESREWRKMKGSSRSWKIKAIKSSLQLP